MTILTKSPTESYTLMDVSQLAKLLSPSDVQRVAIPERIDLLYSNYLQLFHSRKEITMPGVLVIAEYDGIHNLIDGQHRFLALVKLQQTTGHAQMVCVNIIKVENREAAETLFNNINDTIRVSEMPKGVDRSMVNKIVRYFVERYPTIFKTNKSGRVMRPHINPTRFEEEVANLIMIYPTDLLERLIALNKNLEGRNLTEFKSTAKDTPLTLANFRSIATSKGGLYFGMFSKLECFDELRSQRFSRTRKPVNAVLRRVVFQMFYPGKEEGNCLFCDSVITLNDCHMAHDIAHSKGGGETKDNLFPCCATCNLSMGTMSFEQMCHQLEEMKIH